MKPKTYRLIRMFLTGLLFTVAAGFPARADYLPNNFWPNAAFETGTNLDDSTNGVLNGWNRGGSDTTICQIITNNAVSPTHSLAVIDNNSAGYGEWYSDIISLNGHANPGDAINIQWYELYSIPAGEMRFHVLFFDSLNNFISEQNYVVTGDSAGWSGDIGTSTFTLRNQTLAVPTTATQIRVSLTSGGPQESLGVMVVDDVSIALPPNPVVLSGSFWPNPSFEQGASLDTPTGTPTHWNRGGNPAIDVVVTNNYVSASHAIAVVDNLTGDYGSWYSDQISFAGLANPGDILNAQWFELYSITGGEMRVTFTFYNAGGGAIEDVHFTATGNSAGWQGAVAGSGFTRRNVQLPVPANASKVLVQLVSGGSSTTTGIMMIDDLSITPPPPPPLLVGNFWPNPTFESGVNLDQTNGVPAGWVAVGSDPSICQVTTNAYSSPTHALAIIDNNTNGYGEWDADLLLGGHASPGDQIYVQWSELYSIVTNGNMRVTVLFFDAQTNLLSQTDANASGNSLGWQGALTGSSFTSQKIQVAVPYNAVRLRVSLVSGGSPAVTGVYVIDDLSVARVPWPGTVLSYDFFPNPTFEDGAQLGNPTVALPAGGWQRGGSAATIDQVLTNNSVSPSHALALVDNDSLNYGEWYLFLNTTGLIGDNDAVDIQWYELYSVTNGNMRLSFTFLDSGNNTLASQDFNAVGQSGGWAGSVETSTFQTRFERLNVPAGTTQLRVNFASGGSSGVTGIMLIDDLSVRLSKPLLTDLSVQPGGFSLTWNSMLSKSYTIQAAAALNTSPASWITLATDVPGAGLTTSYLDTTATGATRYYRIIQQ